jgi:hypothetical protein
MSSCRSKRYFGSVPNTSQKRMQWRRPLSLDVFASALLITRCADGSFAGNGSASGCTRIAPLCNYGSAFRYPTLECATRRAIPPQKAELLGGLGFDHPQTRRKGPS